MTTRAIVTESKGKWVEVAVGEKYYQCRLSGKLRQHKSQLTNPVAVGDEVGVADLEEDPVIQEVFPRKNYIQRKATKASKQYHLLAANIEGLAILASYKQPRTSRGFINRLILSAEIFRIPVQVIFNKTDLLTTEEKREVDEWVEAYRSIGYECLAVSLKEEGNAVFFTRFWKDKTVLLAGHSGTGKSTLINLSVPGANHRTTEISERTQKGTHTTTFAKAQRFGMESWLIDSPGIREFGLSEIEPEELAHFFPEMRKLLGQCKFHNCQHISEPGCAVARFYEDNPGLIFRYEDYLKIWDELK